LVLPELQTILLTGINKGKMEIHGSERVSVDRTSFITTLSVSGRGNRATGDRNEQERTDMSDNSPSPHQSSGPTAGKAIIFGSVIIAAGIFAGALVLPGDSANQQSVAAKAPPPQVATEDTPASDSRPPSSAGRYQIVKTGNGQAWRLNTETGEITVCRLEADRMICAKSTAATELPAASPQELEKKRAEQRQKRSEERTAMMDRFFGFFERIIRFAEREAEKQPPERRDDEYARPL
jgi:hypothetical protein